MTESTRRETLRKKDFPIRLKLVLLMSGLVLAGTAAYLALAVKLFKDDKTTLVYELNADTVKTLAAQVQTQLSKTSDKIYLLTRGNRDAEWAKAVFESDPDLIAYTLYRPSKGPERWQAVSTVRNSDYLKLYGLPAGEVDRIRSEVPVPFAEVLERKTWVGNATLAGGAPIMTLALALHVAPAGEGAGSPTQTYVAVADLRLDRILAMIPRGMATVYAVDSDGRVLAHADSAFVSSRQSMAEDPIAREAEASPVATGLKTFTWKGERWLGAYSSAGIGGVKVVSEVTEAQAFGAARRLIGKSLLFALIVITAAMLISGFFAHTLTDPLEKLLLATEKLSRWEFGESVHVKTNDEIARLARAFNAMASDLQAQRKQLESHQQELELKVKERTAALVDQKKRLVEVQDTLLRTTRLASLGELAGATAHEVLNPLNNMNIRVERVRKRNEGPEADDAKLLSEILGAWRRAYAAGGMAALETELKKPAQGGKPMGEEDLENLGGIAEAAEKQRAERHEDIEFLSAEIARITRIVNNMRALSRVGGERRPVDVHAPIDETFASLTDLFQKNGVSLVKDYSADARELFSIVADKDELVQVFSNLARNAMHAIRSAKRRAGVLRVSTRRQGDRVEVRVADNGTGIQPEHLGQIFEPTFTTKSVEEGTGLGLSISRRLVRAFDGDIEVETSAPGEGTTFLLWFPAAQG